MTALMLLLAVVAAAKYVECRRLKRRIARFQTRERAYRKMARLMALSTLPEPLDETPLLTLVEEAGA